MPQSKKSDISDCPAYVSLNSQPNIRMFGYDGDEAFGEAKTRADEMNKKAESMGLKARYTAYEA